MKLGSTKSTIRPSFQFKNVLKIILSFTLIHSSMAIAQEIPDLKSPVGTSIFLDTAPHASNPQQGQRVYYELSGQQGFRTGFLKEGLITWSDGATTKLKTQQPMGASGQGIESKFMPSQLKTTFNWGPEGYKAMRERVQQLKLGDFKQSAKQAAKSTAKATGRGTVAVGGGVLAFYAAMAIGAAFKMSTQYGNDPYAWNAFLDEMKDPYAHMTIGIFGTTMTSVYLAKRMTGKLGITKSGSMGFGSVALGLGLGIVANTAFSNIVYHEKFDQCWGFDQYWKTGTFKKDLAACDEVARSVEVRKLADDVLPALISGSIALGIMQSARSLMMSFAERQALQKLTVLISRIPKANWVTGVGTIVLFSALFTIVNDVAGIGQLVSDLQRTKYSFQRDSYGATISANGQLLMTTLSELMKNPKKDLNWDKVCVRKSNGAVMAVIEGFQAYELYNCENPKIQYLPSVLSKYKEHSQGWRAGRFATMMGRYESYVKKTNDYYTYAKISHEFYYKVISALQTGDLSSEQLEGFVDNKTLVDPLLRSMVCGPNEDQTNVITQDGRWHKLWFDPPRVTVDSGMDSGSDVRERLYKCKALYKISRQDLIQKLKNGINPLFKRADGADQFQDWWTKTVTPSTRQAEEIYYKRYQKLLKNSYIPALSGGEIYSCEAPNQDQNLELFRSTYSALGGSDSTACDSKKILRVYKTVEESMAEEIRVYLSTLANVYSILRHHAGAQDSEFLEIAKKIMQIQKEAFAELRKLEAKSDSAQIEENLVPRLKLAFEDLSVLLQPQTIQNKARADFAWTKNEEHLFQVSTEILRHIGQTFTELKTYLDVLKAYDLEAASDPTTPEAYDDL